MLHKQTLPRVLKKNLDRAEALKDIESFSILEGDQGDRLLEHLALKFQVFQTARDKTLFQAGFDEGVRAVLVYLEEQRVRYPQVKQQLEVTNG